MSASETNKNWMNRWKIPAIIAAVPVAMLVCHNIYTRIYNKINSSPPGPYHLPFAGILPYIIMNYEKTDKLSLNAALAKDYGDIVAYNMFNLKIIQISNSKLAKKILMDKKNKDLSSTRKKLGKIPLFTAKDGEENFVNLNGIEWSRRRKLFLSALKKMLTTKFMNKVSGTAIKNVLIPEINQNIKENKPFYARNTMKYLSFQTTFYALFDRFIAITDPLYVKFRAAIEENIQLSTTDELISAMIWKTSLPKKYYDARDKLSDIVNEIMDQRRSELQLKGIIYKNSSLDETKMDDEDHEDLSSAIKDLEFDSYLDYLLKLVDEGKIKNSVAEVETLLLFAGGYANVAMTLEWTLLLLAKYPSIQQRVREELFAVNKDKNINKNDININEFDLGLVIKCPLFRAFIYESLRISSFARSAGNRDLQRDINVEWKGKTYKLRKGYMVTINVEHMMTANKDEGWKCDKNGDITGMHLENFLDEHGRFKINGSFALFGYGVRDCPGRAFAVKAIQINIAYIMMNYKVEFFDQDKNKNPENVPLTGDKLKFTLDMKPQVPVKFTAL